MSRTRAARAVGSGIEVVPAGNEDGAGGGRPWGFVGGNDWGGAGKEVSNVQESAGRAVWEDSFRITHA